MSARNVGRALPVRGRRELSVTAAGPRGYNEDDVVGDWRLVECLGAGGQGKPAPQRGRYNEAAPRADLSLLRIPLPGVTQVKSEFTLADI